MRTGKKKDDFSSFVPAVRLVVLPYKYKFLIQIIFVNLMNKLARNSVIVFLKEFI